MTSNLATPGSVRVGISGWRYPAWRGDFYPRPGAAARAGVRRRAADHDRDQRLVLLAAAAVELPQLVRADARRLRVRGQGWPVHHPHEEAARRRDAAGQLLRVRRAGARDRSSGRSCGSCRRSSRFDAGRLDGVLRPAAAHDRRGRRARASGTTTRSPDDRVVDEHRRRPAAAARARGAATTASRAGGRRRCCASTTSRWSSPTRPGKWPLPRGRHGRLRLRAPARRRGAVRQRLHAASARRRGPASWRAGATAGSTSTSTSTTT